MLTQEHSQPATEGIDPNKWYSVPQAAKVLNLTAASVREFVRSKQIRARRARPKGHSRILGRALIEFREGA